MTQKIKRETTHKTRNDSQTNRETTQKTRNDSQTKRETTHKTRNDSQTKREMTHKQNEKQRTKQSKKQQTIPEITHLTKTHKKNTQIILNKGKIGEL